MKTYIVDSLFEKYTKYAASIIFKDSIEADKYESEDSKAEYTKLMKKLSEKGYYRETNAGNYEESDNILQECLKNYKELNRYYVELNKATNVNFFTLRTIKHLGIIAATLKSDIGMSGNDEIEFKEIYENELDYFNVAQYRYDFIQEPLFNKLVIIFLSFSTILRLIKRNQDLSITDQNVNEYYLNNFLVSHGFLYYNNISYDKKKAFTKHIIEFYNGKGSLKTIKTIVDILNDKDVDIFEYYLFYDEKTSNYYFLKVKPDESFINIFNNFRSDREENYNMIVDSDPSWIATEADLKLKDIRFLKSKYFSIDSYSDTTDSSKEVSFLIDKLKRYRDLTGKIYKFDLEGFSEGIEMYDYMSFITLLSMKINYFNLEVIKTIDVNENTKKFQFPPKNNEGNVRCDPRNDLADLIMESVKEIQTTTNLEREIEAYKKYDKIDTRYNNSDMVRSLRNHLNKQFSNNYRPLSKDSTNIGTYAYLVGKYPEMKKYLDEEDLQLLSTQFLGFVDNLERILMLYGQAAFKFKDVYSNLYLPKIIEIVNFFKSMNAHLLEFNSTLSIEKESRLDIAYDSYTATGVIKISNRDVVDNNGSIDPDYQPEMDFDNKNNLKDPFIDLVKSNEGKEVNEYNFGKTQTQLNDGTTVVEDVELWLKYTNQKQIGNRRYFDYADGSSFIDDYSYIFDTEERMREILNNSSFMYYHGKVIDFYGSSGSTEEIRKKYGLNYTDFNIELKKVLNKYHYIFASTMPRTIRKMLYKDVSADKAHKPFRNKNNLFRSLEREIKPTDRLFIDRQNRSSFSGVLCVFEAVNGSEEFTPSVELNKRYRYNFVMENSKTHEEINSTGVRTYGEFFDYIKRKHDSQIEEDEIIGGIPEPSKETKSIIK